MIYIISYYLYIIQLYNLRYKIDKIRRIELIINNQNNNNEEYYITSIVGVDSPLGGR